MSGHQGEKHFKFYLKTEGLQMGDRLNYIVGLSAACVEKENTVSCVQAHKRTKK